MAKHLGRAWKACTTHPLHPPVAACLWSQVKPDVGYDEMMVPAMLVYSAAHARIVQELGARAACMLHVLSVHWGGQGGHCLAV